MFNISGTKKQDQKFAHDNNNQNKQVLIYYASTNTQFYLKEQRKIRNNFFAIIKQTYIVKFVANLTVNSNFIGCTHNHAQYVMQWSVFWLSVYKNRIKIELQ